MNKSALATMQEMMNSYPELFEIKYGRQFDKCTTTIRVIHLYSITGAANLKEASLNEAYRLAFCRLLNLSHLIGYFKMRMFAFS